MIFYFPLGDGGGGLRTGKCIPILKQARYTTAHKNFCSFVFVIF